jgi:hypothetical protein
MSNEDQKLLEKFARSAANSLYPELAQIIKMHNKDINDCPTRGCSETGKEVSRYALKLDGLYRQMVRSYCSRCKSFYVWPVSVLSKEEYKKLRHETKTY